jgi:putative phage-type endonuclease
MYSEIEIESEEQWHEERHKGIGGSEAAIILNASKWKTPHELFLEKINPDHKPAPPTGQMKRGTHLEPYILKEYCANQNVYESRLERTSNIMYDPDMPEMRGTVDAFFICNFERIGIVEAKSMSPYAWSHLKNEGLPQEYIIQVQDYMEISGLPWTDVACLNCDTFELEIIRVERDPELGKIIRDAVKKFWQCGPSRNFSAFQPPELPAFSNEIEYIETQEWKIAAKAYNDYRKVEEEAKALKDIEAEKLKNVAISYGVFKTPGLILAYWKPMKGRKRINNKQLFLDHPEIDPALYTTYGEQGESFRVYNLEEEV